MTRSLSLILTAASLPLIASCGGGGGGTTTPPIVVTPPPPPVSEAPVWQQGQFEPASTFKNQCDVPRTGVDLNGNAFPDEAGSLAEELFWLRSWSDETYLWYDEIQDQNPNNFSDKLVYFDELKTEATTVSGNPKDRFHFTYDSEEWQRLRTTGASGGYGAEFALIATAPPRDIRIAYVDANGPAGQAGLVRGTKILTIDGVSVVNGSDVDTLNDGLFPENADETHVFGVEYPDGTTEDVTLVSAIVEEDPVNLDTIFDVNGRTYGYVHFTTFSPFTAEEQLFDAFDRLEAGNIDDLVLDLRYNGGGLLAIASQLSYMVAGDNTDGFDFETLQFNDKANGVNPVTGETIRPTPFYKTGVDFTVPTTRQAPTVNKNRVFVLTTGRSCSASEAVINGLRGIDVEVIQIGSRTCGKPYGFYATDNCGTTYFTIQFRGVNSKNFGDYADGFAPGEPVGTLGDVMPGCTVADDFTEQLGDPAEAMLSAAITYAETGACPVSSAAAKAEAPLAQKAFGTTDEALDLMADPRIQARELARTGRLGR